MEYIIRQQAKTVPKEEIVMLQTEVIATALDVFSLSQFVKEQLKNIRYLNVHSAIKGHVSLQEVLQTRVFAQILRNITMMNSLMRHARSIMQKNILLKY